MLIRWFQVWLELRESSSTVERFKLEVAWT